MNPPSLLFKEQILFSSFFHLEKTSQKCYYSTIKFIVRSGQPLLFLFCTDNTSITQHSFLFFHRKEGFATQSTKGEV
jgi:hypothetical protein